MENLGATAQDFDTRLLRSAQRYIKSDQKLTSAETKLEDNTSNLLVSGLRKAVVFTRSIRRQLAEEEFAYASAGVQGQLQAFGFIDQANEILGLTQE